MAIHESHWKPDSNFGLLHRPMIENLSDDQLRPIVEAMAGEEVRSFVWDIDRCQKGKKGFYGYKLIPLFRWTTKSGVQGSKRCCMKQVRPLESVHYRYLERFPLPMCRLYGAVALSEHEEIVVLEYVDPIGHETLDDEGREWFVSVKAKLNAVTIDENYATVLTRLTAASAVNRKKEEISQAYFLDRLFMLAAQDKLGGELKELCRQRTMADADKFERVAAINSQRLQSLPSVLTNIELDVGLQPESGQRRCFDVHSTCLGPQFGDLRQSLGRPTEVDDGWGPGWPDLARWANIYAAAFNSLSPRKIAPDDVIAGARIHWIQHAVEPAWKNWFIDRSQTGEPGTALNLLSVMRWLFDHLDRTSNG